MHKYHTFILSDCVGAWEWEERGRRAIAGALAAAAAAAVEAGKREHFVAMAQAWVDRNQAAILLVMTRPERLTHAHWRPAEPPA